MAQNTAKVPIRIRHNSKAAFAAADEINRLIKTGVLNPEAFNKVFRRLDDCT